MGLVIEQALLHMGKPSYDKVEALLYKKYSYTIADSCDNPQYLCEILKEVFGKSYLEIINSIETRLTDFRHEPIIDEFVSKISK